ncbi:ATP-binding protein [Nitrosomonas sp.]|uniref:ATP-binding protein n=1 Tax=Nitrosomonas sp. TaxID=42353 RepID=UPI003A5C05F5
MYEKTSLIITTNLDLLNGCKFLAMKNDHRLTLDHITHHCDILETGNDSIDLNTVITHSTT